jgi:hypothetical protein
MIIDCYGHYTTALREPLEKAGLKVYRLEARER